MTEKPEVPLERADRDVPVGMLRQLTPSQLAALVLIADTGSFTEAAVSHLIGKLEQTLGRRVLERTPRGAAPTALGLRVAAYGRRWGLLMEALHDELQAGDAEPPGVLRVAGCSTAIRFLALPLLERLRRLHPAASVEVVDYDGDHELIERAVLNGEAHVGFGRLPVAEGLRSRVLLYDEYLLVLPRDHPSPKRLADVQGLPFIHCGHDTDHIPWLQQSGIVPPAAFISDSRVILSMISKSPGVAILSGLSLADVPAGVVTVPLPQRYWRAVGLMVAPEQDANPLVRTLLGLLDEPAWLDQALAGFARPELLRRVTDGPSQAVE